jgi:lipoic acid synthetase
VRRSVCPNIGECFGKGTATFMIMGDKCTRRCPFCDVGHGRPDPLDADEPENLAKTIAALKLKYVVITSVDRDDLRDGGAALRRLHPRRRASARRRTQIEVLVPDFRGRDDRALDILKAAPPDVMNHNLETVPRLYKEARPGSDYAFSLNLLKKFKAGGARRADQERLMVGLGETDEEILQVMRDMRAHDIDMLTIGQYLAPSGHHLPVRRYVHPDTFAMFEREATAMGFSHAAVGALVRSSYHADQQAHAAGVRAAESAVPAARQLLVDTVRAISVEDALKIVKGGDTSVTAFFQRKTRAPLGEQFLPIVTQATEKVSLADKYNRVAAKAQGVGLIKPEDASIQHYVTRKALDGLYWMIGEEEKKIRKDPVGTGSAILKKVFGL